MKRLWMVMVAVVVVTFVSTAAPTVFEFTADEGFVDGYIGSGNNGNSPDLINGWDFHGSGWDAYGYEDTAGAGYMTFGANWSKISNGQYYWVGNVGDTLTAQIDFGLTLNGTLGTADILQIVFAETGIDANASDAFENSDRMTIQTLGNGRLRVYHAASGSTSWPQVGPDPAPSDSSFIDSADLSALYSITIGADAASSTVIGTVSNRTDGTISTISTNTVSTTLYNAITGNGAFLRMYQGNNASNYKVLVDRITLPEQDTRVFLTVDNLSTRNDASFGTAGQWTGTASQGLIEFAPGYTYGGNLWGNPVVVPMRWSGIDLDEDGNDDYFDFELHGSHSVASNSVVFAGNGFGASPWSLTTLNGDVTFEIKNIELSSGTSGTVSFEQFTAGAILVADWGAADPTWPLTTIDMNGVAVGGSNDVSTTESKTYTSANNIFSSSTLVVNNPSVQEGATEQIWFRSMDFGFSYVNTNASTVRVDSTNAIEFVTAEGYSDGVLTGQNGMAGGSNWVVNTANGGEINSAWYVDGVTNENQHITLPTGIGNLVEGDEVSLTIDLTIDGDLTPLPDGSGAAYGFNIGFQADNSPQYTSYNGTITNDYTAIRFQRFRHNTAQATYVRLLSHPWATLQGYGYGSDAPLADVSAGDQLQISLTANIGTNASSSSTSARYINVTAGTTNNGTLNAGHNVYVNNNVTPFPESLYNAFTGETGAYAYFEAGYQVENWPTNITITRVELAFPVEQLNTIGQSAYSVWAAALGLTDAQTNLTADVDGDGFNNLFEYALNGNPTDDSSHGSPVFDAGAGTYSYTMRTDDDSLTVTVLETTDLVFGTWTTNTSVTASTVNEAHDAMVNSIETNDNTKFIRLIIERD